MTSIGEFCFLYCESLNGTITIPNSVTSLGPHCFQSCQILDTIIFQSGSTITSLPFACFNGCAQLTSINIPSTVTSVGAFCFQSCSSLTIGSITYDTPSSVTSIGGSCFNYCTGLDNLPFVPSSVTSFGTNCFANCTGLGGAGTIQIPSSIQNLGDSCFLNCTILEAGGLSYKLAFFFSCFLRSACSRRYLTNEPRYRLFLKSRVILQHSTSGDRWVVRWEME